MGMPLAEFWQGDIYLARVYREAYERKKEVENQKLWLQGLYTFRAVSSAIEIAMWNGKGSKPEGYLKDPIPITKREIEAERQRKIQKTLEWVRKGQE